MTRRDQIARKGIDMKSMSYAACLVLFSVCCLLLAIPANAHHSLYSEFNHDKVVTISGVISSVEWVNPHIYLYMDAKDPDGGQVKTWAIETFPPNHMKTRFGLTKAVLVGDGNQTLKLEFNPAANGKLLGWLKSVTYPDGHVIRIVVDPGDPESK
jgi:hypothetical protein